jgi:hypothetical protein
MPATNPIQKTGGLSTRITGFGFMQHVNGLDEVFDYENTWFAI